MRQELEVKVSEQMERLRAQVDAVSSNVQGTLAGNRAAAIESQSTATKDASESVLKELAELKFRSNEERGHHADTNRKVTELTDNWRQLSRGQEELSMSLQDAMVKMQDVEGSCGTMLHIVEDRTTDLVASVKDGSDRCSVMEEMVQIMDKRCIALDGKVLRALDQGSEQRAVKQGESGGVAALEALVQERYSSLDARLLAAEASMQAADLESVSSMQTRLQIVQTNNNMWVLDRLRSTAAATALPIQNV